MARKQTVQTAEQLQAAVAEIKTVAAKKSARGTTTPKPAQTGVPEAASSLSDDDQQVVNMIAKLRTAVAKSEEMAREQAELFNDDQSIIDLAVESARAEKLRLYRKQLKSGDCDPIVKRAISKYLDSLKPVDKLAGARGRKASFLCKIGNGGNIQITGTYSNILGWESGTILEIKCENNQLILSPKSAE